MSGAKTERCRAVGCPGKRSKSELVCRACWHTLPPTVRDRVWSEYRTMPGSRAHLAACAAALKILRPVQGALFA